MDYRPTQQQGPAIFDKTLSGSTLSVITNHKSERNSSPCWTKTQTFGHTICQMSIKWKENTPLGWPCQCRLVHKDAFWQDIVWLYLIGHYKSRYARETLCLVGQMTQTFGHTMCQMSIQWNVNTPVSWSCQCKLVHKATFKHSLIVYHIYH